MEGSENITEIIPEIIIEHNNRPTTEEEFKDLKIMEKSSSTTDHVDGGRKNLFASKKSVAEGMMDIALLTANANQLRYLITYNSESKTFFFSLTLIILSLMLQIAVGIALIFKRQLKNRGNCRTKINQINDLIVGGVFIITTINVFAASFSITEIPDPKN